MGTDKQPDVSNSEMFSHRSIKSAEIKEFGVFHLLSSLSANIGLTEVLSEALPKTWSNVLTLAFFMVVTGEPVMYCEDWLSKNECFPCGSMTSQRISELLCSISDSDRFAFFEKWGAYRSERECFALDITSVSSYSELIREVGWGYNRDHESLPQVNVCLIVGEESRLPVFQAVYQGAIKDVSTLEATLEASAGIDIRNISIVMDKGFYSKANIDAILSEFGGVRFLISVPFTSKFAKNQVQSESKDIEDVENAISIGDDTIYGITKNRVWDADHKVFTHVYHNALLYHAKRNELNGYVAALREKARENPLSKDHAAEFRKYLCIRKSNTNESGYTISIRKEVIEKKLRHAGWMVAISNYIDNAKEAIRIYRSKDAVEKCFDRMKNNLDLARLRVHSDVAMQNKLFVCFIAMILVSRIDTLMGRADLFKKMSLRKMFKVLEGVRFISIHNRRILQPLTSEQKAIFDAFQIPYHAVGM
jgi:transposase